MKKTVMSIMLAGALSVQVCANAAQSYGVVVNGDRTETMAYDEGGKVMIPLRAVAEKLGFNVTWNGSDSSVVVDDGTVTSTVVIGIDSYSMTVSENSGAIGATGPLEFGIAPQNNDGTTYVPSEFFSMLIATDDGVAVDDGVVTITNRTAAGSGESVQIPSPIVDYAAVSEARAALAFDVKIPEEIPEGYEVTYVRTISGELIQIEYTDKVGGRDVLYRTARGDDDISGDFNGYAAKTTLSYGGFDIVAEGDGAVINKATWTADGMTYSITSEKGLSESDVKIIAESIK